MQKIKNKITKKDLLTGLIFLVFAILMLAVIIPYAVPVSFVPPGQISPRFLPEVLTGAILVFSALLLLLPLLKKSAPSVKAPATEEEPAAENAAFLKIAPFLSIAVIIISYLLLVWFGFIACSIFSMAAIMFAFGERNIPKLVIVSLIITALVWLFAVKLLNIPLP